MVPNQEIELRKLRYVLYARKSTEDESRQIRSIPDQIKDCEQLAANLGICVVTTLKETKSAKRPNQRPIFTQLLKDIEAKKYDAIICWHPDRLCRNMLEGGKIIDMIDEGVLQDIRFYSHQFSNDANGKMLLGMLFVFSKQYSDDLSAKVNRGVKGNFAEGKSNGQPKHGYDRDEQTGYYRPNQFFDLIKSAWHKRAMGEDVRSIAKFLLANSYCRQTKPRRGSPRKITLSASAVARMFHDPFYYGILIQAACEADLRGIYDFEPMIDEVTYDKIQLISRGRTRDITAKKRVTFYPLRGMVYCAICNSSKYMVVGKSKSRGGQHFLYYRCDNKQCLRKPTSMRAAKIFDSLYVKFRDLELTDEAYDRYIKQIDNLTDEKIINIKQKIHSSRGALSQIEADIKTRSLNLGLESNKESKVYVTNQKHVEESSIKAADLRHEIQGLEKLVANPQRIKLSREEFLNLVKTASDKVKAGSAVEKDALARILLLNLYVDSEKVVKYTWREPFASLIKSIEFSPSSGGGT
ncbi:MAG TPA: recombinase family protein [Candidatus Saccharimonadales bacterium]|nr:recombinase family protein [Candidatus Saccharimonadales bacterium]